MTDTGFSGSRHGGTPRQLDSAHRTLSGLMVAGRVFRHGDCIGWDALAHDLADALGFGIVIHPPTNPKLRAWKPAPVILPPKPYLERNRDIVNASRRMIICPDSPDYRAGSGTWYTWKYARERGTEILLILPDGSIRREVRETLF